MERNGLLIGIILLSICVSVPVVAPSVYITHSSSLDSSTITITPSDGLYWNSYKIVDYPVPLFIHYYFKMKAIIPITLSVNATNTGGFERVEIYINDVLQYTIEGPGPHYGFTCNVTITPFHHSPTYGIKVYVDSGEFISDNVTIYRLFP